MLAQTRTCRGAAPPSCYRKTVLSLAHPTGVCIVELHSTNAKLFYLRSINPMIEKINPTIPIPITSSPIPDEQREIIMAKSSIAIPNPIFFIVNPPLQMSICCHLHYTSLPIKKIAYFMKLVGWEQLATQGVPRWQVHKRVAGGSQRRGSVASPV